MATIYHFATTKNEGFFGQVVKGNDTQKLTSSVETVKRKYGS